MKQRRNLTTIIALIIAAALTMAACARSSNTDGASQDSTSFDVGTNLIPVADRTQAPDVRGQTLDNQELGILDYDGFVLVVNAWGSWCAPCRAEAPALEEVYRTSRADGVRFVGIDTRDQAAAALAFQKNFDITYPSLFDPDGQLLVQFNRSIPPSAIPTTLVIDRQGRIAASIVGPTTFSELSELVAKVANEPAGGH